MKTLQKLLLGIALAITPLSCHLPNKEVYTGSVFFVYGDKENTEYYNPYPLPKEIMNDLEKEITQTDYYPNVSISLEDWLDREASKYGKDIDVLLTFYPEQIKVSDEFYSSVFEFGETPSLALGKLSNYLKELYPDVKNSDFVAIIYNAQYNAGYARSWENSFLVFSAYSKEQSPEFETHFIGNNFAHEFLHLLGAEDTDKSGEDIMESGSFNIYDYPFNTPYNGALIKEVIINEETARDIRWLK